jgi:hypothetical protein
MFKPIGLKPRWETVYEMFMASAVGDVLTYDELATALGTKDRTAIRLAVREAAQRHEERDKRAVDSVRGVGYRIVEASEQLGLARRHQRKASRSLARGHSKAVNVDLTGLPPDVRHAFEVVAQAFSLQMDFNRRFDVRQQQMEQTVKEVTDRTARSENEIAELRARLGRLEGGQQCASL